MGLVAVVFGVDHARADTKDEGVTPTSEASDARERDFFARGGFGITPVSFRRTDHLPEAHQMDR